MLIFSQQKRMEQQEAGKTKRRSDEYEKIIAFIVVIALLVIAFFYVYSRTGDVFPSSNADLIILSEHGKKKSKLKTGRM